MSERRQKTAEILGHVETFVPMAARLAGIPDSYAKLGQGLLQALIYALGRGKSPDELAHELRQWADTPAARVDVDSIGARVRRELGERDS